ncbi:MAG: aconitase X catalytic domain-containing protein [Bacillota bacterium]|nr:aconitase X catalytic domain-containing protein [Bacillota bacterium]
MFFTKREEDMLFGRLGKGTQMAMDILFEMGKIYGAKRFIPITCAHIGGCCYSEALDAGLEFAEKLASLGAKVAVPSTLNITARDIENWEKLRIPPKFAEKSRRLEVAYTSLGCTPTWSCTPCQCGNAPHFGEDVVWSEASSVNFVNSVFGARTNRYPEIADICCAVCGIVPESGLHLKENRRGRILFNLQGFDSSYFLDSSDYAVLGYVVGKLANDKIPVINGLPKKTNHDNLKAFAGASSASGREAMFHIVGVTPEARTEEEAFQGRKPEKTIEITEDIFAKTKTEMSSATGSHVDLVLVGCPHASFSELLEVRRLLDGKKVKPYVRFWVQTGGAVKLMASRTGLLTELLSRGVTIVSDTCVNTFPVDAWGFHTIITNSGRMAHFAPDRTGAGIFFANLEACVNAAVTGEVRI